MRGGQRSRGGASSPAALGHAHSLPRPAVTCPAMGPTATLPPDGGNPEQEAIGPGRLFRLAVVSPSAMLGAERPWGATTHSGRPAPPSLDAGAGPRPWPSPRATASRRGPRRPGSQPVVARAPTPRRTGATGSWPPTVGSSPSATPPSMARWAARPLNEPDRRNGQRRPTAVVTGRVASDGRDLRLR